VLENSETKMHLFLSSMSILKIVIATKAYHNSKPFEIFRLADRYETERAVGPKKSTDIGCPKLCSGKSMWTGIFVPFLT
jgi:hypothetical protein